MYGTYMYVSRRAVVAVYTGTLILEFVARETHKCVLAGICTCTVQCPGDSRYRIHSYTANSACVSGGGARPHVARSDRRVGTQPPPEKRNPVPKTSKKSPGPEI